MPEPVIDLDKVFETLKTKGAEYDEHARGDRPHDFRVSWNNGEDWLNNMFYTKDRILFISLNTNRGNSVFEIMEGAPPFMSECLNELAALWLNAIQKESPSLILFNGDVSFIFKDFHHVFCNEGGFQRASQTFIDIAQWVNPMYENAAYYRVQLDNHPMLLCGEIYNRFVDQLNKVYQRDKTLTTDFKELSKGIINIYSQGFDLKFYFQYKNDLCAVYVNDEEIGQFASADDASAIFEAKFSSVGEDARAFGAETKAVKHFKKLCVEVLYLSESEIQNFRNALLTRMSNQSIEETAVAMFQTPKKDFSMYDEKSHLIRFGEYLALIDKIEGAAETYHMDEREKAVNRFKQTAFERKEKKFQDGISVLFTNT